MNTKLATGIALSIFILLVVNILSISYFIQNAQITQQNLDKSKLQTVGPTSKNETVITTPNKTVVTTPTPATPTPPKKQPAPTPIVSGAS